MREGKNNDKETGIRDGRKKREEKIEEKTKEQS